LKFRKIVYLLTAIIVVTAVLFTPVTLNTLSKRGSRGDEVLNIQKRLSAWGYYDGSIDGIYGSATEKAVKKFQKKHGLKADGIAGAATLEKLGLPGSSSGNSSTVNLLARAINGEARGEPYIGQVAVGAVILNRVNHPSFPGTVAGVIYQPGAFTAVSDGQIHAQMEESSIRAAKDALNGWDPSGGAIYYYNPRTATNQWIRTRPVIKTIGKHVFCD